MSVLRPIEYVKASLELQRKMNVLDELDGYKFVIKSTFNSTELVVTVVSVGS